MSTPFVLHTEWVASPEAKHWLLMLHGIFGRGSNWRGIARALVQRTPHWGCALVDLREHGNSTGAPAPHTIETAASDVAALVAAMKRQGRRVRAISGHSFGGKVALATRAIQSLPLTIVLDSSPGKRGPRQTDNDKLVGKVLELLATHRGPFATRRDFVDRMVGNGIGMAVAQWLAMNLARRGEEFVLAIDPSHWAELLASHGATDVWPQVESCSDTSRVEFVAAGRDSSLSPRDLDRLAELGAARSGLSVAIVADAGHWLHTDAPDQVVDLLAGALKASASRLAG